VEIERHHYRKQGRGNREQENLGGLVHGSPRSLNSGISTPRTKTCPRGQGAPGLVKLG
jgi:hypothetical protein